MAKAAKLKKLSKTHPVAAVVLLIVAIDIAVDLLMALGAVISMRRKATRARAGAPLVAERLACHVRHYASQKCDPK